MRVLIVATKSPWPPVDGGRVLLWNSLRALREAGVEVSLVAPGPPLEGEGRRAAEALAEVCEPHLVPLAPASGGSTAALALGSPLTIARHTRAAVRQRVDELLALGRIDVVHAEQLQALPQVEGARARGIPLVLRAQNVESDLWSGWAGQSRGVRRLVLRAEGWRLARWEGRAVRSASAVWALSPGDAARLAFLAGAQGSIEVVRPPFPALPEAEGRLAGSPAVVIMGSQGWRPNEDAVRWFIEEAWPEVLLAATGAVLHLFGGFPAMAGELPGIHRHPAPSESGEAFVRGSIQAVPLRVGSGVRIKILEAWARGVPVVGTRQAFAGLEAESGVHGLVASRPQDFARAISDLHRDAGLAARIVEEARKRLRERHAPALIGRQMAAAYERLRR